MSDSTSSAPAQAHDESGLVALLNKSESSDAVVSTTLKTDDRVIARVTDGIYRQPASSLRELLSNAFDADATRVVVKTDAPRFERISVEDNGNGMSPEILAHLLFHIGGSAKRSEEGVAYGITQKSDPLKSPNGRRLIGKIGIGLFSVSQLTHNFQIVTKVKGDHFRTIATIALKQFSEDDSALPHKIDRKFESGRVNVWRERASDVEAHGTTITLTSIRPQARDTLRSRELWSRVEQSEKSLEADRPVLQPPTFHIGRVDKSGELLERTKGSMKLAAVPWEKSDSPKAAFDKLVGCVWAEVEDANPNPSLERIFDYYLRMIWQLSLAVPLPYVNGHLFDESLRDWADGFLLSNEPRGSAEKLKESSQSLRQQLDLRDPAESIGRFDVFVDDVQLSRPIRFRGLPTTNHKLKRPVVFIGRCKETFPKIAPEFSGGPLSFEAYLFWTPKVAPTEHRGSLIRIHGSSGTLFDPTFMRYQVSELTRLRQITCEIFVTEGLDSALNIDRESFNHAHPHSVYITRWLHEALRQLATAHKRLAGEVRGAAREESADAATARIQQIASELWREETADPASVPPNVELTPTGRKSKADSDSYVFPRAAIVPEASVRQTPATRSREAILEEKLKALVQVMAAYELFDLASKEQQLNLLRAFYKILEAPER